MFHSFPSFNQSVNRPLLSSRTSQFAESWRNSSSSSSNLQCNIMRVCPPIRISSANRQITRPPFSFPLQSSTFEWKTPFQVGDWERIVLWIVEMAKVQKVLKMEIDRKDFREDNSACQPMENVKSVINKHTESTSEFWVAEPAVRFLGKLSIFFYKYFGTCEFEVTV